jgi:hypothetical protein
MKKYLMANLIGLFLLSFSFRAECQWSESSIPVRLTLPEIALVDIEPSFDNSVRFDLSPVTESGASPQIIKTEESQLWLNYTSSSRVQGNQRKIIVQVINSGFPEGFSLSLKASEYSGNGKGKTGSPSESILLSDKPRNLISGIGNCYTGDGIQNGHLLNFTLKITNYTAISNAAEFGLTILYTITDN